MQGIIRRPNNLEADTGEEENGVVRIEDDPYDYPDVEDMIKVTIEKEEGAGRNILAS